ncbi:MAG: hypothetical protein ACK4NR_01470 [Micavibrio sp.]
MMRKQEQTQQGNILFLILIAVALFAALSYAATQGLRTSGKSPQEDNKRIRGIEIIQYATFVSESIIRMKFRGITDESFCFDSPQWGHTDYDFSACSTETNKVFSTAKDAGNVIWLKPPDGANAGEAWYITGSSCLPGLGTSQADDCNGDGDPSSEDLIMFLPNIGRDLCIEINNQLSITNPGGNPPRASGNLWNANAPYTGTFADGGRVDSAGSGDINILRSKPFGCVEANGTPASGTYAYYHVLIRR